MSIPGLPAVGHWDEGLIPDQAQWAKDPALPQLQRGRNGSSHLIPDLGTPYAVRWLERKKENCLFLTHRKRLNQIEIIYMQNEKHHKVEVLFFNLINWPTESGQIQKF